MAQDPSTTSELRINVTPRNRANLRRLKTNSIQSYQRWEKENELLYAMIEDESAWLSSLFPDAFITPELFFYALEDGTVLCLLANFIQEMAENYGARTGKRIPGKKFTFHKSKKGSRESKLFHSRENVDKFLTWCRLHGIPEAILFESNDAVQVEECRTGGREIVICLMEIARRSSRYEIEEVPQLIRLEREIEEEELIDVQSCAEEHQALLLDTSVVNTDTPGDRSPIDSDSGVESVFEEGGDSTSPRLSEFMADDAAPESTRFVPKNKSTKKVEGDKKPQRVSQKESNSLLESSQPKTELDKKVCKIAQEYNIKIVHRLKEGKYIILGKTMFVRMLNDHLLVRIGGGWDTLEHYVMTHAAKPTVSEGISTTPPNSSDRKNSGVWSKLVDKVKRRESQPNLTDSPVVISKRERPESSPSVYRLRDRVKKKLSITEKDEKEISNAIRKIETSLTHSNSPSFTSKTFFQLKNRFDYKGRKSSRENIFAKRENRRMTDQNNELFTGEQQEQETKHEINGTTMVFQPEQPLEPETTETSQRVIEEFSSSTTTVTECSSSEVRFDSGTDDFQDDVTDGAQNIRPAEEDLLLIGDLQSGHTVTESERQSETQSFPTTDTDIFSNQNEPLFLSETLQPERPEPELQGEKEDLTHKDDEEESRVELPFEVDQRAPKESETAFFPELAGEIESQPTATFPEAGEAEPSPFVLEAQENQPEPNIVDQPDPNIVDQPDPNIQEQPENVPQVAPAGGEAELVPEVAGEIETEPVKLSPEAGETESALFGLVAEENQPEPYKENQAGEIETEPVKLSHEAGETESAPFDLVAEENQPEPYQENQPEPYQENQPESYQENQLAGVDDELSELPMEHFEKMSDKIERPCDDGPTDQIINDDIQATSMTMEAHSIAISKEEEQLQENESGKDLSENMDTGEQELEDKNSPETSPETDFVHHTESSVVFVADSEEFADEKKQSNINVEEEHKDETVSSPETEEIPPVEQQNVEVKAEHVDKIEEKEVKVAPVDKSVAAVDHKKPTKKSPGTTKTEHEKATNISTFKNTAKDQKAERPKGSATKPTSAKTSKTTTTTTASKTKTKQPSPGVHAATKRPASAQTHKIDSTTSKPAAKKLATNGPSKTGHKTTSKPSEPRKTTNTTNGRPISTKRPTSNGTPKSEPPKSRPQSTASKVASTKTADKTDGKAGSTSRPASAKPKPPTSATTRTTIKKTTTTKTSGGPASKSEVSKTTTKTNKGGVTSSTTTTIVTKTTEPGGKSKASRETKTTAPHQKAAPVKNKTGEVKSGPHAKPGTATTKQKPASGSTRGKPASTASKGKPSSERPKSPSKGKAKETTVAKDVAEVPSEGTPAIGPSDTATPLITEESKDSVTTVVEHTEMIEDDGQTKIVHTKEVTERVLENGEQQTITTETSLEESA